LNGKGVPLHLVRAVAALVMTSVEVTGIGASTSPVGASTSSGSASTSSAPTAASSAAASKRSFNRKNDLTWRPFVYGGIASVTAECFTFPIDTSKTRLQIQGQASESATSLRNRVHYRGMTHAISSIARDEGLRALYFGIKPAVFRQATYGTIKFGVYYRLKSMIMGSESRESLSLNVCLGVVAGATSAAITTPTDVLKVRMQAQTGRANHELSLAACFIDVYRNEGLNGLWRGVGPTAQRAAVVVGVELPVYDCTKHRLLPYLSDGVYNHFASSMAAGFATAIASTPIDVVKTRMMNQRNLKPQVASAGVGTAAGAVYEVYSGSIDCLLKTLRHEGPSALYKGFIPNWVRLGPWNVVFFITYEQLKKL